MFSFSGRFLYPDTSSLRALIKVERYLVKERAWPNFELNWVIFGVQGSVYFDMVANRGLFGPVFLSMYIIFRIVVHGASNIKYVDQLFFL